MSAPAYAGEWRRLRLAVLARDRRVCRWCGARATEADHLVPVAEGGASTLSNLVAACRTCNAVRGGLTRAGRVVRGRGAASSAPRPAGRHGPGSADELAAGGGFSAGGYHPRDTSRRVSLPDHRAKRRKRNRSVAYRRSSARDLELDLR
jgi:hypothetical protein